MTDHPESFELVTILETGDPALLMVVKSVLDGAGIRYLARGEGVQDLFAGGRIGAGFNPFVGPVQLQVAAADAEEAAALLQAIDEPAGDAGDGPP